MCVCVCVCVVCVWCVCGLCVVCVCVVCLCGCVCVCWGVGSLDVFRQTWSKDFTATPHSPPLPDFPSRSPTHNLLGSQFGPFALDPGSPGRRWGPFPCSMPFHFLSLRTSQISSQGHGRAWDSPLTTHAPLVSLPLSRAHSQALPLPLPCPVHCLPIPQEGRAGALKRLGFCG